MNVFWGNILKWMFQIFAGIIGQMTPAIIEELKIFLTGLYKKALATPNPFDDFAVGMLLDILGIQRPPAD
jgi:hypothetical protein